MLSAGMLRRRRKGAPAGWGAGIVAGDSESCSLWLRSLLIPPGVCVLLHLYLARCVNMHLHMLCVMGKRGAAVCLERVCVCRIINTIPRVMCLVSINNILCVKLWKNTACIFACGYRIVTTAYDVLSRRFT